jgi:MoaA/NifB/PqqE/SkfB family radical SAM enzyme
MSSWQEFPLLGVESRLNAEGNVEARATGRLAPLVDGQVQRYFGKTNDLKVLAQREGGNVYTIYHPPTPSKPGMKLAAGKLMESVTRKHKPSTATIAITNRCQCRCEHCSAEKFMKNPKPVVTTEEIKDLVDQALDLGVVTCVFVGGEPLLHPDIYDLIAHVDQDEAIPMIFTNGHRLTEDGVKRLADAGLYSLNVSIDDVDPEVHDAGRGIKDLHKKAAEGVRRCLDAGLLTGISSYANREKVARGEVEQMIDWGRELGVHEVTIFDIVPTGKLLREEEKVLLTPEDKKHLQDLAAKCNADPSYPGVQMQATVNSECGFGCFAAYWQFYMTAAGDITPCDFTPLMFGNIREDSLATIWERMTSHEAYCEHALSCRMQNPEFRRQWIDTVPDDADLPYAMYDAPECQAAEARRPVKETVEA